VPTEEHKAAYCRIIEAVNAGNFGSLDALFAADMVDHNPVPGQVPGLAGFKQWMATARHSFPDLRGTVGHVLAEGDLVAGRVTWRGTQAGPFAGAAPTGQSVAFEAYHIARFEGGKVAEWWGTADIFGALAQLGVLPVPG
jgi:predicted ester cyclase